jgi:Mn2+/Fe2+ NRAMP family transporter
MLMADNSQVNHYLILETTLVATIIILCTVLLIVLVAQNYIQYVLYLTGGVCGVFILFFIPCYLVLNSRQKTKNMTTQKCIHESSLKFKSLPYILAVIGFISLVYNIVRIIFN